MISLNSYQFAKSFKSKMNAYFVHLSSSLIQNKISFRRFITGRDKIFFFYYLIQVVFIGIV